MNRRTSFQNQIVILLFLCFFLFSSCNHSKKQDPATNNEPQKTTQIEEAQEEAQEETEEEAEEGAGEGNEEENEVVVSQALLTLEAEYTEMLAPISSLKTSESEIYWFIVSWLNTAYRTPDWTKYYSDEWKRTAKQNGIDCSGFSRVMLDQIFDKEVAGGSQGLLDNYCAPVGLESLEMGDLVFFNAPYSTTNKIVHVGVYLQDNYFVHATSTKSADKGLGLSVNSLQEENWAKEFVSGGKVKD